MSTSAPTTAILTATERKARNRRALQHGLATPIAALLLLALHQDITWQELGQIGAGFIGAGVTWLLHNTRTRRYAQAVVPVVFAVITAGIPILEDNKITALHGAAAIVPLLQLLAAPLNAATPTKTSTIAGEVVGAVADVAEPPVARAGGTHQSAVSMNTTRMQALTDAELARMDAQQVTSATAAPSTTSAPASAVTTTAPPPSQPAGFAANTPPLAQTSRRLSLRGRTSTEDQA